MVFCAAHCRSRVCDGSEPSVLCCHVCMAVPPAHAHCCVHVCTAVWSRDGFLARTHSLESIESERASDQVCILNDVHRKVWPCCIGAGAGRPHRADGPGDVGPGQGGGERDPTRPDRGRGRRRAPGYIDSAAGPRVEPLRMSFGRPWACPRSSFTTNPQFCCERCVEQAGRSGQ